MLIIGILAGVAIAAAIAIREHIKHLREENEILKNNIELARKLNDM